jgi:hypothetical protein
LGSFLSYGIRRTRAGAADPFKKKPGIDFQIVK